MFPPTLDRFFDFSQVTSRGTDDSIGHAQENRFPGLQPHALTALVAPKNI